MVGHSWAHNYLNKFPPRGSQVLGPLNESLDERHEGKIFKNPICLVEKVLKRTESETQNFVDFFSYIFVWS